ncbi:hypothetical protein [Nitrosopumilus spindle-shaped virus]|uniref:Uncharacterized protein n=1 Tax=Nitrosopumilus spindle-shaped virus TaxID=2508184 RepID=A0A514K394_9VIRU|nr:hypothetical protein [Nitrosopumilus spindle-shaped virus]
MNTFSYENKNGFEVRHCRTNSSTYNSAGEDFPFELRIRHEDPELIEVLKEKIMEWINDKECEDCYYNPQCRNCGSCLKHCRCKN